ncbi:2OG-Fe dioxygenase family protein [Sphingomonas sp. OTU376]|uniref:2OG-Fe dioxygenase family protein n=1 Tax=Sphingomonas sp. OTU376 TaxID=3043863 RepID=UPI00313D5090
MEDLAIFDLAEQTAGLRAALADRGYVHVDAGSFRKMIGAAGSDVLDSLAALWGDLEPDSFMADGGRYRRRRHAAFELRGAGAARKPDQPHFQSSAYNPLNGDVERWFAPAREALVRHPVLQSLFALCTPLFSALENEGEADLDWDGELHQFRIEALGVEAGLPTPEGMHRDGVDWVLVMLIDRSNVEAGMTEILDEAGRRDSFTLSDPGEVVLLDDRRIRHGVTAIHALDPSRPAYRDVLVMTWRRRGAQPG